jgi:AraC-like DNA-binding protein
VQREVRKRLEAPPSLAQLARQLNISERTLRRRIDSAGLGYQGIIDESRLARALALLGHGDLSLAEVAQQTDFSDVLNFRRAFKYWTGVAPRETRKGCCGNWERWGSARSYAVLGMQLSVGWRHAPLYIRLSASFAGALELLSFG